MRRVVPYLGAWLGTVALACAMALVAPNESSVMGYLPASLSHTLMQQAVNLPSDLPSERTLALITFKRAQHTQAESWIEGLNLRNDPSIGWMRMPVLNDPGTTTGRSEAWNRLLKHYPNDSERAKLVPLFTDRDRFVRAVGLNGIDQVSAVVVNRQGDVLARVEGHFDADKAQLLRETLNTRSSKKFAAAD